MKHFFVSVIAVAMFAASAQALEGVELAQAGRDALPSGFKTTPLVKATTTAGNDRIVYPAGEAEIVSVIGELEQGGRTARHQHPVPVFVYVLEGVLMVQADGAQARTYKAGEAYIEDVDRWHQAFNRGNSPAKILVVFAGAAGKPTSVNAP
jgi:quercetin dioxygenase-like cupin family protein